MGQFKMSTDPSDKPKLNSNIIINMKIVHEDKEWTKDIIIDDDLLENCNNSDLKKLVTMNMINPILTTTMFKIIKNKGK